MKRLWVFGDNNSAIFGKTKERRFKFYKEYRNGVFPKSWSELLASTLNLELKNLAVQGQSNYDIFDMFCNVINDIKKDDIVMIGWAFTQRFRMVDIYSNSFTTIRQNQFKTKDVDTDKYLKGIDITTINKILDNRLHPQWNEEIYKWEQLINKLSELIGFKIVYWTFDKILNKPHYLSTTNFREDLIKLGAQDITCETDGVLVDDNFGERGHLIQFEYFLNNILYEK
jgi:hypothetical protein